MFHVEQRGTYARGAEKGNPREVPRCGPLLDRGPDPETGPRLAALNDSRQER